MAMTAAERKRRQVARQKEERERLADATYPYLGTPFFEVVEENGNWSSVTLALELAGLEPPVFQDDSGPLENAFPVALPSDEEDRINTFSGAAGSIGRAEVLVDCLLDAATELAQIINDYKRSELRKFRQQTEAQDLSDPAARKKALQDLLRIEKMEGMLAKKVRRELPVWSVKLD
ncbi:hypothetical protein [Cereibacter sphaeroides]|uniref:hypothetical protein n=1 Tax=Cereibacter sphaeroides TaxID=1063 RepID=UPI001F1D5C44|nr:hypothetical protein [Cereibacter sphaeroides]MCE6967497.1 hypothetical protein [Cereibacter sphaeroides]